MFKTGGHRIWVLNHTAAVVWCLLDEAGCGQDLINGVVARFKIDATTAARDIAGILGYFATEGLITTDEAAEDEPDETEPPNLSPRGPEVKRTAPWPIRYYFSPPGMVLEFCSEHMAMGKAYCSAMSYLETENHPGRQNVKIWVLRGFGREKWDIALNGCLFFEGLTEDEILPHAFMLTFASAASALNDKFLFHAAVLGKDEKVVIFPGKTGSGKTTLTAVLARQGWQFFSDELAVMDSAKHTITSFPLPMSIKSGAVSLIEPFYPGLGETEEYCRPDGKIVRYLAPPAESLVSSHKEAEVRAIIFPIRRDTCSPRLLKTEKVTALRRLAQTGSTQRGLQPLDIQALITVVENTPCYDMFYADIQQVAPLLAEQLAGKRSMNTTLHTLTGRNIQGV
ncbi:PqqD family peptide modification chaperone [Desulfobacterota bacterium M19]